MLGSIKNRLAPSRAPKMADCTIPQPHRALFIPELLEQVLLYLRFRDVLSAKQVSKHFENVVLGSPQLRKKLWLCLTPTIKRSIHQFRFHPLFNRDVTIFGPKPPTVLAEQGWDLVLEFPHWHKTFKHKQLPEIFKHMPLTDQSTDLTFRIGSTARCCTSLEKRFYSLRPEISEWTTYTSLSLYDFVGFIQKNLPRRRTARLWRYGGRDIEMSNCAAHNWLHKLRFNGNGNDPCLMVRLQWWEDVSDLGC